MAFVLGIIRILIVLLIVRIVVSYFARRRTPPPVKSPERLGGTLVRDPQCGTHVPESRAIKAAGLFFCSAACRDAWMAAHGRAAMKA